jgi:hypothetical protein
MPVTTTEYTAAEYSPKGVRFTWTADATGNATATTSFAFRGKVLALVTIPGTPLPSDQYDITIKDPDGYDVLQGNGTNLGNSTIQTRANTFVSPVFGNLTLAVTNAGNGTQGACILYVDPMR